MAGTVHSYICSSRQIRGGLVITKQIHGGLAIIHIITKQIRGLVSYNFVVVIQPLQIRGGLVIQPNFCRILLQAEYRMIVFHTRQISPADRSACLAEPDARVQEAGCGLAVRAGRRRAFF